MLKAHRRAGSGICGGIALWPSQHAWKLQLGMQSMCPDALQLASDCPTVHATGLELDKQLSLKAYNGQYTSRISNYMIPARYLFHSISASSLAMLTVKTMQNSMISVLTSSAVLITISLLARTQPCRASEMATQWGHCLQGRL